MKKVGLIKGRHALPVNSYILENVKNPTDFDTIEKEVRQWFNENIDTNVFDYGMCLNQADYTDVQHYRSERLVVYVTGLTAALSVVIKVCAEIGAPLTLMHFDKERNNYIPQEIFR